MVPLEANRAPLSYRRYSLSRLTADAARTARKPIRSNRVQVLLLSSDRTFAVTFSRILSDTIVSKDGTDYNCRRGTHIRIKTVQTNYQTLNRGERLHIIYWGQLLLPDLTESTTRSESLIHD